MSRRRQKARDAEQGSAATARRRRQAPPSWRQRAREVLQRLRAFAHERQGQAIEAALRERFAASRGEALQPPMPEADLERAFDDLVCAPGSADGETRSLVRAFAEEAEDLEREERQSLPRWEQERRRGVWLLERAWPERLELWDPLEGQRVVLHLLDRLDRAGAAALPRGTVVIGVAAPWQDRSVVFGALEFWQDDEAIALYRREVKGTGRPWHDMPPPVPTR